MEVAPEYSITGAALFGSRAAGTAGEDSDVDLILEFSEPVSLITLNEIRFQLEDLLGLLVDIVHGPLRETDLIGAEDTVELMAAPSAAAAEKKMISRNPRPDRAFMPKYAKKPAR